MSTPLYQLKTEFFKTPGHPARTWVLELLSERKHAVRAPVHASRSHHANWGAGVCTDLCARRDETRQD
jgi:hypothetical protein